MSISKEIIKRLKDNNKRFFSCDNVSEFIYGNEKEELINELTEKFNEVLKSLIIDIENDPNARETGKRLAKMYVNELMEGRFYPEPDSTSFPNDGQNAYEGMLVVKAEIKSMCAHHHQVVSGIAYIGIIPKKNVIGLSKYIRIARHLARRATLQEELCVDIKNSIVKATSSEDVAVHLALEHGCCINRGVMAHSSLTQTTVLSGAFYKDEVRQEFFDNIKLQKMGI